MWNYLNWFDPAIGGSMNVKKSIKIFFITPLTFLSLSFPSCKMLNSQVTGRMKQDETYIVVAIIFGILQLFNEWRILLLRWNHSPRGRRDIITNNRHLGVPNWLILPVSFLELQAVVGAGIWYKDLLWSSRLIPGLAQSPRTIRWVHLGVNLVHCNSRSLSPQLIQFVTS